MKLNEPLRVVIITTKLPEDIWLINKLADVCQIEGIVFPSGTRYREYDVIHVLKKRLRWNNLITLVNQALLIIYRLILENRRDKRAIREIFSDKPTDYIEKKDIDIFEVEDVNSEAVKKYILSKSPQLVVVSAAPLLKKRIIEAAKGNMINLHPGFAPQYRGRYGAYWPIYNKEPELVGVTIHYIDSGIDTGAILLQQQIEFNPDDTLKMVNYKQHNTGVNLLIQCLKDYERLASQAYHKNDCPSNNYLAPGLTHYLKARRWLKRRTIGNEV
jgi:folate-dependent phosphoribosylglycinamide formyltransferase PurN